MIKQLARLDTFVILTEEDARNWDMLSNKKVIPNPLTKYPDVHSSQNNKIVISVGRYDPVKGFDLLIDAWSIVASKHPDWNLRIVGPGDRTPYQEQVNRLGLEDSVCLKGASDQIYDEMSEASFYVLSSRSEGFGLVLVEAMAVGLPCVAFSCSPGPRSIVSHQRNGLLAEKDNVKELANAICYMIENDKKRMEIATQAIIDSEIYGLENIMQKWISLFSEIV